MFASTVLHLALTDLCSSLDAHAMARLALGNTGDDRFSSHSIIGNYHDDGGILIPNEDMQFAYKEFDRVGKPHSLCANWDKSGALVTLDPNIQPTSPAFLDGISILWPEKVNTSGTVFLGTKLGHPSFIAQHLNDKATKYDECCCRSMQCQLDDLQTKTSLFHNCLQGTIPCLLAADIALRSLSAIHPIDPYAWSSPLLLHLNAMTSDFQSHISGHPVSHFHPSSPQWTITHVLISMGSLGFQDYTTCAVASFIIPLA
jgi:hypothetical protein